MTALPSAASFTGSTVTEAQFKTAITDLRTFLSDILGTDGTDITALQSMGALGNTVSAKTGAYTVVATDRGAVIDATTGTWTLSLTAAATLGNGFAFLIRNSGSGTITIDPNSTELIDGASTKDVAAGASYLVVCNGTGWKTIGNPPVTVTHNGEFRAMRVYTSTTTWTKPAGLARVKVTVVGGGGGGGGADNAYGIGGGGGAGGCAIKIIEAASLGATETVTIGSGGTAGSVTGGNGGVGGTSSYGAHCSATGGSGGAGGVGTATPSGISRNGGNGGIGSGGAVNFTGGGGGAASAADTGLGAAFAFSGAGGPSYFGGNGAGSVGVGNSGTYGGGGSGAASGNSTGAAGGVGGGGVVIVEEFYA